MTVDWCDFDVFDPEVWKLARDLPRKEARTLHNRHMAARFERIEVLRDLLARNGVELGSSDDHLQAVNDWFVAEVEPDPEKPGRMKVDWYAVCEDLGLWLGEVMIERCPGLRWEFCTWGGKRYPPHQRSVITGFRSPTLDYDPMAMVVAEGHRIVATMTPDVPDEWGILPAPLEPDYFWRVITTAESFA